MAGCFMTDLAVSVGIVLVCGWLFAGDVGSGSIPVEQNEVYVALGRFAPQNLFFTWLTTLDDMGVGLIHGFSFADGFGPAASQVLATIGRLVLFTALAGPYTLAALYRETSGTAAWIVLAGFGMTTVLACLFAAGVSRWRLLVALVVSPIAASILFLMLQGVMVLMAEASVRLDVVAPYVLACPLICTLYWVAFPGAERSATQAVARAISLALDRRRR
jgi:hypothetical protein